jgi:predicted nucleic acid-binding Zn ribbon protein
VTWRPLPRDGTADPRPLEVSLAKLAADLGAPAPRVLGQVFGRWEEIVGPDVAAHARPLSLRQGTLIVGTDEPAWAAQLQFLSAHVLARLEEVTGSNEVRQVTVRVVPP